MHSYSRLTRILIHSSLAPSTVFGTKCSRKSAKQNDKNPLIKGKLYLKYIIMISMETLIFLSCLFLFNVRIIHILEGFKTSGEE